MDTTHDGNALGNKPSDVDDMVQYWNEITKRPAFDFYWAKLEGASGDTVDLDVLRICVRLLPLYNKVDTVTVIYDKMQKVVSRAVLCAARDAERHYLLAEICLSNQQLAVRILNDIISSMELHSSDHPTKDDPKNTDSQVDNFSMEGDIRRGVAYLRFLRSSYWLPPDRYHLFTPELLDLLVGSIGKDDLNDTCLDTLSALLTLLSKPSATTFVGESNSDPQLFGEQLFSRFQELPSEYFSTNAAKAFQVWLQWISHAGSKNINIEAVHSPSYWSSLRTGLLTGFADQRKYSLGILRQSLLVARHNINIPQMTMDVGKRFEYLIQYDRFATLFETIVLDRYPNQVLACLPELTKLFDSGSLISSQWTTALLSAALSPRIQDGIRKLVGKWYLEYVTGGGPIQAHEEFLIEGFLPWATQGSLFNSSLSFSRTTTGCSHGEEVADAIARFTMVSDVDSQRGTVLTRLFTYVLDTGGRIFSPSILYLLEGILKGLSNRPTLLNVADVDLVSHISRLPSIPEIATDLCTIYCGQLLDYVEPQLLERGDLPGFASLRARCKALEDYKPAGLIQSKELDTSQTGDKGSWMQQFLKRLEISQHKIIQDELFEPACEELRAYFDHCGSNPLLPNELAEVFNALWEEADRQDYPRRVIINLPQVFLHPACVQACVEQHKSKSLPNRGEDLVPILSKVLVQLQGLTEGRSYLLAVLATSLRTACFKASPIISILSLETFLVRFINNPPTPKKEFLFEVIAGAKLQQLLPHLNYTSYYGQHDWHGYAAIIDLLTRFPSDQLAVARRTMDLLLEPWKAQKSPVPIISKWKNIFQLQTLLLLTETYINDTNVDGYLDAFMRALILEPWPRYRFLLEWIIARIYYRFPHKTDRILSDLESLDENSPVHIASLMKLGLLAAPFLDSEQFALKLMVQLIPFSASPKVQVRHEAHWSFPTIFDLASERNWKTITGSPAFQALNDHLRSLDRYKAPRLTIRTLSLDVVKDYTITSIFQGQYLKAETPELERVTHEDFVLLYEKGKADVAGLEVSPASIPLGCDVLDVYHPESAPESEIQSEKTVPPVDSSLAFFQTKSGFDTASLLPSSGPPSAQNKRPASVILIASLIDNPTNLGGLSRISESFGLEALYIDDLKKTAHKDFKATSVTSEKHFPIRELKGPAIPDFLISMKRQGYEVVGIEQTDKSGILGEAEPSKRIGTLPRKCVLVLGSERSGITSEVLTVVDRCVEIKTTGVTRSLNVQTAAGIAVYEWWREWGGEMLPAE